MAGNSSASAAPRPGNTGGHSKRLHVMEALALYVERLAAGREYLHARSSPQHLEGQSNDGLDDMLAVVEHKEHALVAQKGEQLGGRILCRNVEAD